MLILIILVSHLCLFENLSLKSRNFYWINRLFQRRSLFVNLKKLGLSLLWRKNLCRSNWILISAVNLFQVLVNVIFILLNLQVIRWLAASFIILFEQYELILKYRNILIDRFFLFTSTNAIATSFMESILFSFKRLMNRGHLLSNIFLVHRYWPLPYFDDGSRYTITTYGGRVRVMFDLMGIFRFNKLWL